MSLGRVGLLGLTALLAVACGLSAKRPVDPVPANAPKASAPPVKLSAAAPRAPEAPLTPKPAARAERPAVRPDASKARIAGDQVRVDGGEVRGLVEDGVLVFKGIPFAAPPVGDLRWRPPQPVVPWSGVRPAFEFSADPAQPFSAAPDSVFSEDCLYLNVYRPAGAKEPLPVMVWIYGGGLIRGGGSSYPGEYLARQGIVVVTFNYRLGRLGFFAHPALAREAPDDLRGNYGYMDQLAALQWVQRNIAAFGGDPKQVTLAGESAGAGSVLVMLTSQLARGLFRAAILESAGIPSARAQASPMRPLAEAEAIAVEYARGLGIRGDDAAALRALRALPTATLLEGVEANVQAIFGGPEIPGLSNSIIDGRLVAETPESALRGGRYSPVPVIVGANDADLAESPARRKEQLLATFGPLEPEARRLYDPRGDCTLPQLVQALVSDRVMVEPSRHLAERMTHVGQPAWFYRFSYVAEAQRSEVPGALHASEIVYAFDAVAAHMRSLATADDLAMADTMSGYWVDFVKTGDPNGGGRPNWPPYHPARREVLDFRNDGVHYGADPLRERLDLWESVWERSR